MFVCIVCFYSPPAITKHLHRSGHQTTVAGRRKNRKWIPPGGKAKLERQRRAMCGTSWYWVCFVVLLRDWQIEFRWMPNICRLFFFRFDPDIWIYLEGKTILSAGFCFTFGPKMVNIIEPSKPLCALRMASGPSGRRDHCSRHQPDNSNDWIVDQGAKTIAMWLCFIRYIILSSLVKIN